MEEENKILSEKQHYESQTDYIKTQQPFVLLTEGWLLGNGTSLP